MAEKGSTQYRAVVSGKLGRALRLIGADCRLVPFNVLVNVVASSVLTPRLVRTALYRLSGIQISHNAVVKSGVFIRTPLLSIGSKCSINNDCFFENEEQVTIGSRVGIGIGVRFVTLGHDTSNPSQRSGAGMWRAVVVGDGVLIGSGAQIMPGVVIGEGCVIGAGAMVNRDCQPHGLYGGVPARRLRTLVVGDFGAD